MLSWLVEEKVRNDEERETVNSVADTENSAALVTGTVEDKTSDGLGVDDREYVVSVFSRDRLSALPDIVRLVSSLNMVGSEEAEARDVSSIDPIEVGIGGWTDETLSI